MLRVISVRLSAFGSFAKKSVVNKNVIRCLSAVPEPAVNQPKESYSRDPEWNSARPYSEIPGPNGFLQTFAFLPGGEYYNISMMDLFKKLRNKYGDIIKLNGHLNRKDILFIFDPNDIEKVFRTEDFWPVRNGLEIFTYFRKNVRQDVFDKYGGLVAEQGENWHNLRSKVNPFMLKPTIVRQYVNPVDEIASQFIQNIRKLRDNVNEVPSNFDANLKNWSLESIACIALDTRLGLLDENSTDMAGKKFPALVRDFFELSYQLEIMPSLWKYYATPAFKRSMETLNTLTDTIVHYLDRAIKKIEAKKDRPANDNYLSVLEKLLKIDRSAALAMTADMLLAGVDTTVTVVTGTMYSLANNQEKQDKLREEIMQILPEKDTPFTAEKLHSLPYLRACVKEAIRLYPVANGNFRATGADIVLKGYQVPRGTDMSMGHILSHYNDDVFPESSKYIPERWLKKCEHSEFPSAQTAHPFAYLPFGFGARTCVGKRFAQLEIELLISRIVRNFKIEWHHPPLKYLDKFVNLPTGNIKFRFNDIK